MKYFKRNISENIIKKLLPNKVVIVFGARRVGKTVLVKEISEKIDEPILSLNGEDINVHDKLAIRSKNEVVHYTDMNLNGKKIK